MKQFFKLLGIIYLIVLLLVIGVMLPILISQYTNNDNWLYLFIITIPIGVAGYITLLKHTL